MQATLERRTAEQSPQSMESEIPHALGSLTLESPTEQIYAAFRAAQNDNSEDREIQEELNRLRTAAERATTLALMVEARVQMGHYDEDSGVIVPPAAIAQLVVGHPAMFELTHVLKSIGRQFDPIRNETGEIIGHRIAQRPQPAYPV